MYEKQELLIGLIPFQTIYALLSQISKYHKIRVFWLIFCLKELWRGNFLTNIIYDITYPYRKYIPETTSNVISAETTLILPRDETFIHASFTLYTIYKCISLMIKRWKLQRFIVDLFHSFILATHFSRAFRGR